MAQLTGLTPMLQAKDIGETVRFYTEVLGFTVDAVWPEDDPTFCSLDHGPVHVMFYCGEAAAEAPAGPALSGHLYLYTDDVLALHERLRDKVEVLWGPEVYSYGMREFAIREINGYTLAFGQPTTEPPTCPAD